MSYIDVFLGAAVFAGMMIPVTLIIRNVRVEGNWHA